MSPYVYILGSLVIVILGLYVSGNNYSLVIYTRVLGTGPVSPPGQLGEEGVRGYKGDRWPKGLQDSFLFLKNRTRRGSKYVSFINKKWNCIKERKSY